MEWVGRSLDMVIGIGNDWGFDTADDGWDKFSHRSATNLEELSLMSHA